ncbi:phage tail protein [Escherichia coli]|uniref:phage tail protein n=1 Tax=Escherichia coli TaxID=562 RepID=UPI003312FBF1
MATKYFALLTNVGAAKLANATALGAQVEITQMAVGDGNGVLPTPNPAQTALTHELRRAQLNMLTIDPVNTNQIIAEQVIPEDVGGWWIREIGLFDKDGDMIAVANCAETYKPKLQEGSGRVQVIRVILIVSSTEAVTLKIDPSVVLATRKYVDDAVIEVKAYADDVMKKHVASANPHKQYPLIANALKEMVDDGLVNQVLQNLGLGELSTAGVCGGSVTASGYITIPMIINGARRALYIQWGGFTGTTDSSGSNGIYETSNITVTWPVAFPNAVFQVITGGSSDVGGTGQQEIAWSLGKTKTYGNFGFQCRTPNASMTGSYLIIGY